MSSSPRWLQSGLRENLQLLVFEPLFEEANRCRRLIAQVLRQLAAQGIDAAIAELPGMGESPRPISTVSFDEWREAAAQYQPAFVASLRGGALLDDAPNCPNIWRFAPETGARVSRDLRRAALTSGDAALLAGHALSERFLAALDAAAPRPMALRTVRLASDPDPADAKVAGPPLWRRAEPGEDAGLAKALADDLATWMQSCAAS